ncbi:MAG: adenine phosphoribosyltransferase [Minwuia sp.]|nr:adenine phosphoribosyltransferase [Minwuia sp.]
MNDEIRDHIRTIPDYPKPGIMFRDVTTLWNDARGFRTAIDRLVQPYAGVRIDKVAGIEARGFVLGGAVAHQLSVGFVPIRKQGKLPGATIGQDYDLEYGTDRVEIHTDAIAPGENVLVVDDLLATGGTAEAAVKLIRQAEGTVVGCCFIVDLPDLGGMKRLQDLGLSVMALCAFEGE